MNNYCVESFMRYSWLWQTKYIIIFCGNRTNFYDSVNKSAWISIL